MLPWLRRLDEEAVLAPHAQRHDGQGMLLAQTVTGFDRASVEIESNVGLPLSLFRNTRPGDGRDTSGCALGTKRTILRGLRPCCDQWTHGIMRAYCLASTHFLFWGGGMLLKGTNHQLALNYNLFTFCL